LPPACPICHKKMDSIGRGKGYRCRNCGTKSLNYEKIEVPRSLKLAYYEVPGIARRHLSKPIKLLQKL
jgi:tRNA(Ile2)-agmatinylcytidine synthase